MEALEQLIESLLQSNSVPSEQGGRVVEEIDFRNVAQQIARGWEEYNAQVEKFKQMGIAVPYAMILNEVK